MKIQNKNLKKGLIKSVAGFLLLSILPASLATGMYFLVQGKKDYNAKMNEVQSSTEFQEFRENELTKYETKFQNAEINLKELQTQTDYIYSKDFVKAYAESYDIDKYNSIIKSDSIYEKGLGGTIISAFGSTLELVVLGMYHFGKASENKERKLAGKSENLPEVNLE